MQYFFSTLPWYSTKSSPNPPRFSHRNSLNLHTQTLFLPTLVVHLTCPASDLTCPANAPHLNFTSTSGPVSIYQYSFIYTLGPASAPCPEQVHKLSSLLLVRTRVLDSKKGVWGLGVRVLRIEATGKRGGFGRLSGAIAFYRELSRVCVVNDVRTGPCLRLFTRCVLRHSSLRH